ncbi:4-hydroxy-tetrahydrodipicolinate reductase [Lysobacter sp. CAU 1642]|uniref:4-hydroxy-tetrahydrodipicolinate reductase n=1 Tax=Pseudomarimonas salicorniae TaxID=2933270 RepID=A0ABT0GFZ3_9GAMM|nr:4-hydroxy-tetrahydrodipicolinate reductase [Lysobacter sp. CAU 1642]MCK7593114.1 4-hydroxy-tetrahydrodipicolinate reductase [Lysobacter sp. CAU 1642]
MQGASGRLGRAISELAGDDPALSVRAVSRDAGARLPAADVLIDVSVPDGLARSLDIARQQKLPLVCGTTGLGDEQIDALRTLASEVPVLHARNFSLGVAALARAAGEVARLLDWDVEIVEAHHRHKRDAPSGTALALGERIAEARERSPEWSERVAAPGPREPGSIGMAVLRGGSVVGDHSIHFLGEDERIELRHQAEHRRLFARGALLAARRLIGRPAAWYSFEEVLWS